jgi:hypothetical protein
MLMSPSIVGVTPALHRSAEGADPSTAGEPCRKRFDPDRSVEGGGENIFAKMVRHFFPAML